MRLPRSAWPIPAARIGQPFGTQVGLPGSFAERFKWKPVWLHSQALGSWLAGYSAVCVLLGHKLTHGTLGRMRMSHQVSWKNNNTKDKTLQNADGLMSGLDRRDCLENIWSEEQLRTNRICRLFFNFLSVYLQCKMNACNMVRHTDLSTMSFLWMEESNLASFYFGTLKWNISSPFSNCCYKVWGREQFSLLPWNSGSIPSRTSLTITP